ncbi:hypothetical protein [Noviherbaspirillum sp. ST9]|uniref:hypothetical protein n=1 Tax=Noviherbaspirillum sp. ST9 TaxID=3401606 RepID=UPI003B587BC8
MTTLTIIDLSHTGDLDRAAMSTVRGGMFKGMPAYWMPFLNFPQADVSLNPSQFIGQSQSVVNNNGNNAAFVGVPGLGSVPAV